MDPLKRWQGVAVVAMVGWAGTTWVLWPPPDARPARTPVARQAAAPVDAPTRPRAERPERPVFVAPPRAVQAPDAAAPGVTEEALQLAREEVQQEMAARRAAFHSERLDLNLERMARYVEDRDLDAATHEALDAAVLAHHDRVSALFAGHDGPPTPEMREEMGAAFQTFRDELVDIVPEEDLDLFMARPGGGRGSWGPDR